MSGAIPRNLKKNDVCISNRFPGVHKRGGQNGGRASLWLYIKRLYFISSDTA